MQPTLFDLYFRRCHPLSSIAFKLELGQEVCQERKQCGSKSVAKKKEKIAGLKETNAAGDGGAGTGGGEKESSTG